MNLLKSIWAKKTLVVLILANLFPIVGIFFLNWKIYDLLVVYFNELIFFLIIVGFKLIISSIYFYFDEYKKKGWTVWLRIEFTLRSILTTVIILFLFSASGFLVWLQKDMLPDLFQTNDPYFLGAGVTTSAIGATFLIGSHTFSLISNFVLKKEYISMIKIEPATSIGISVWIFLALPSIMYFLSEFFSFYPN